MSNIEAFLARLHHPTLAGIDLSLDRMHRLLSMLGSPERRLPPVVHVAGTNGKGSLIAYLQSILGKAGYRVHSYTSPHLVHFRERIIVQGKEVNDRVLENALSHVASILPSQPATFFEATTAAAFLIYAEHPADVLLLETGLGGRLDATNVIAKPLLTAITPISFDHCEYLGRTIDAIAMEKAGIIKKNVACVIGRQEKIPLAVLEAKANELSAPLYRLGEEWQVEKESGEAFYRSSTRHISLHPSLAGEHQYDNAATAIACLDQLPFKVSEEQINEGLAVTRWPARLQPITHGKFAKILPPGVELWLDGGHNPQGGQVLARWLKSRKLPAYLICGMTQNKDAKAYMKAVAPFVSAIYAIAIPDESSHPADKLALLAESAGAEAHVAPSLENALQSVLARAKTPAIIMICGSLYLAGKVLAANEG